MGGRLARVVDDLLAGAERAVSEQDWGRVLALCEDALALDPDHPDAAALRALAERHVGRAIPAAGRRQVTVLFADMVGSTAMGEELDPEAYLEVIRAYETACRGLIDRYGGHVNRFAGDGLIAFFGYPNAHEDDALRATLAGLHALDALRRVSDDVAAEHGVVVAARVAVHTGPVVVGDRGSAGWTGRDDAFGPTVNLAARLQSLARPGTVLVSDATAPLLGPSVELTSLGPHDLAGVDRPVEAFEVVRALDDAPRARADARTELVGRAAERARLLAHLDAATAAPGDTGDSAPAVGGERARRAVALRGEAGVGKSRLLDVLVAAGVAAGGDAVVLQCSPHAVTRSLHPLRGAMHRAARIAVDDPPPARLAKLVERIELLGLDADEVVPYLAIPLGLDTAGRFEPLHLDGHVLKEQMLDQLVAVVTRLAAYRPPFVVAVEDAQWADPMTLDLVRRVVREGPAPGVVVAVTCRPGAGWPVGDPALDVVDVGPLPDEDVRRLAGVAAAGRLAPEELDAAVDEVVRRSDGVPLYVSELVESLAAARAAGPAHDGDLPLPLTELLQSRLDSVGAAKAVAQVAATIGREFELPVLERAVAALAAGGDEDGGDLGPERVSGHVARLIGSHLVEADTVTPDRLRFHHALVRDAAYGSQLRRVRRRRHRAVADVLVELDGEGLPVDMALVAYHRDQGGDARRAVAAYVEAAERAAGVGAFDEAQAHLARATELLPAVEPAGDALRAELDVDLARWRVTSILYGWGAPGLMDDFARSLELCAKASADDPDVGPESLRALLGVWSWHITKGELDELREPAGAMARQLRRTPLVGWEPVLAVCDGTELFYRGRLAESLARLEEAVDGFAREDVDDWGRWPLPNDPLAGALAWLGCVRMLRGDEDGALAAVEAGVARSRAVPFPMGAYSEAMVRSFEAWAQRVRGEIDAARRAAREMTRLGEEHGFAVWVAAGQMNALATEVVAAPTAAAVGGLAGAIATYRAMGCGAMVPSLLLEQAAGHLALGDLDAAGRDVDDALGHTVQRYARADGLRLRAEVRAARGEAVGGVARDLDEAAAVAGEQGAALYLGRITASRRRLLDGDPPDGGARAAPGAARAG
jgi:class 3 adenylate cyclase/tetratricopeptide (TPR) repeat protein